MIFSIVLLAGAGGCMYSAEPRPSHGGELAWLSCLRRNIIIMKLSSTTDNYFDNTHYNIYSLNSTKGEKSFQVP